MSAKKTRFRTPLSNRIRIAILSAGFLTLALGLIFLLMPELSNQSVAHIPIPFVFIATGLLLVLFAIGGKFGFGFKKIVNIKYQSPSYYSEDDMEVEIEDRPSIDEGRN